MMLWKCCTQYASKFGKLSSGHRTGRGQFSFQSQRKAMLKNAQTTTQQLSSHMLAKNVQNSPCKASAICEPWTSRCSSWFYKRWRNQRSNCQHLLDHWKSKRVPEKHLYLLYWLCQSLWLCGSLSLNLIKGSCKNLQLTSVQYFMVKNQIISPLRSVIRKNNHVRHLHSTLY